MNKAINPCIELQMRSSRSVVSGMVFGALLALLSFAPSAEAVEFQSTGTVKSIMTDDSGRILFQINGDSRGLCDERIHGEYTVPGDPQLQSQTLGFLAP